MNSINRSPFYIYVASSWRNPVQPHMVNRLRDEGFAVYDFRNPVEGNSGFSWKEVDGNWREWTVPQYRAALEHPVAQSGFNHDVSGLDKCDACVLVKPCGDSSHLEAGYAAGLGRAVVHYFPTDHVQSFAWEPELMRKLGGRYSVTGTMDETVSELKRLLSTKRPESRVEKLERFLRYSEAFRNTAIVDDDFPEMRDRADRLMNELLLSK